MFGNLFDVDTAVQEYKIENKSSPSTYSGSAMVLFVSGDALVSEQLNRDFVQSICSKVNELNAMGTRVAIVVGAGSVAQDYSTLASTFNASKTSLLELESHFSRANALLLMQGISNASPKIAEHFGDCVSAWDQSRVPVMASSIPGVSGEATASLLAEFLGVSVTFVKDLGAFFKRKKNLESVNLQKLLEIAMQSPAAEPVPLDVLSCHVLQRASIMPRFVNPKQVDLI